MKYFILILLAISVIVIYFYYKRYKNKEICKTKTTDLSVIKKENDRNNKLAIKVETLPVDSIKNENLLSEIKDSRVLAHINNAVPELIQVGNNVNNVVQANSKVLYQAIIPAGTKLTNSNNMSNAVRGMYHGSNGIKGHANLVAVDQSKTALNNTISSGIGITSMVVGQYYMTQINDELAKINDKISKISNFQNNEYKSRILALVIQVKRISSFQAEILENQELRESDIDKLNTLEQTCIELLGQANLTITEFTKKDDLDYKKYNNDLTELHNWHIYQKTLLELLYKITELKNVLYLGSISKEQLNLILDTYTKQVMQVHENLVLWHKNIAQKLEIDVEASRRKRKGFDGAVHWIPGLFNEDFNFSSISENTKYMIEEQKADYNIKSEHSKDDLFNKDVKLISKDGKIYYLPE